MTDVVAVLGAGGTMGLGMARNIARSGIELVAWNRSRAKAKPLAGDGAQLCDTAAEAASSAQVIVTMLSDADAVLATMQGDGGALAGARPGSVWIQSSTIGELGTARCAELAREHGVDFVDAPVLGTKQPAQEGTLVVLASGPEALRERVQPVFDAVGRRTQWVGEQAGAGTRLKLVTNAWIVSVVEGAAETIALAEGLGLGGSAFLQAIDGGPLDMPYLRLKATAMIERDFEPTFALKLATKDARLAVESADRLGLDLPVLEAIGARMQEAVPEHGEQDLSATFLTSAPRHHDASSSPAGP
jgi:3-hydroxyisobutyrate dehydrogenase